MRRCGMTAWIALDQGWLTAARVVAPLAHGTFSGVVAVVAAGLVREDRKASAISAMLTVYTCIQPILSQLAGLAETAVSGVGMIVGDRSVRRGRRDVPARVRHATTR